MSDDGYETIEVDDTTAREIRMMAAILRIPEEELIGRVVSEYLSNNPVTQTPENTPKNSKTAEPPIRKSKTLQENRNRTGVLSDYGVLPRK